MAKVIYRVIAPDGTPLQRTSHDYVGHTLAVIGYMRLRKPVKPLKEGQDPEDPSIVWNRFKKWVLIGTCSTQAAAEAMVQNQDYKGVTEETQILPLTVEPHASTSIIVDDDDDVVVVELPGDLSDTYALAALKLGVPEQELREKYKHLDHGRQKMTLNNRLRGQAKREAKGI
jgi:hypothetical protein